MVLCLLVYSSLHLAILLYIKQIELFGGPKSSWYKCPFLGLHSLVAFSVGCVECFQQLFHALVLHVSELFLWALCTCVFQSDHVLPLFFDVYPDRWRIIFLDHMPGGWLSGWGKALVTSACALSSPVSPCSCSANMALTRPAPPCSVHPLSVLSLENL